MSTSARFDLRKTIWGLALAGYWLAMVFGTHSPRTAAIGGFHNADKWLHLTAYAGLAFLALGNWRLWRPLGLWQFVALAIALAGVGALDEITQAAVGRDCDIYDWLADLAGIVLTATTFAVVLRGSELWSAQ